MIFAFFIGLACLAFALPARDDGPWLNQHWVRRRLWQVGVVLCAVAIVGGDFHAGGVSALLVMTMLLAVMAGLLLWFDRGRFDDNHMRRSLGWYFSKSGPGGWPMGGHRMMVLVTVAFLLGILVLRPVARDVLGLDTEGFQAVMIWLRVA